MGGKPNLQQSRAWLVSGLELVEPDLFLHLVDGAADRLARLTLERLDDR